MMKLFYSKGACSLAPHIVFEELGIPYEAIAVDLRGTPDPEFLKLNPMGAVPTIVMENGEPLCEVAAIVQYLADLKPEAALVPRPGTLERLRLQESLNFIATEIHKGFGPLWYVDSITQNPGAREEIRNFTLDDLGGKFDILERKLGQREYLMPWGYSVADAYLYTIMAWAGFLKVDLSRWPALTGYLARIKARPAVIRTLKAEHLLR